MKTAKNQLRGGKAHNGLLNVDDEHQHLSFFTVKSAKKKRNLCDLGGLGGLFWRNCEAVMYLEKTIEKGCREWLKSWVNVVARGVFPRSNLLLRKLDPLI